jgi:hypothetical protein
MKRTLTRLTSLALVALALLTTTLPSAAASSYYFAFEGGSLLPWVKGNDPGAAASTLTLGGPDSFCPATTGVRHARLTAFAGYAPFSGLWMQAHFPAKDTVVVKVSWAVKDQGNCLNCYAMAYIGTAAPASSAPFVIKGPVLAGWTVYSYSAIVPAVNGQVWVALGWKGFPSGLPAAVGIYCGRISITP